MGWLHQFEHGVFCYLLTPVCAATSGGVLARMPFLKTATSFPFVNDKCLTQELGIQDAVRREFHSEVWGQGQSRYDLARMQTT